MHTYIAKDMFSAYSHDNWCLGAFMKNQKNLMLIWCHYCFYDWYDL